MLGLGLRQDRHQPPAFLHVCFATRNVSIFLWAPLSFCSLEDFVSSANFFQSISNCCHSCVQFWVKLTRGWYHHKEGTKLFMYSCLWDCSLPFLRCIFFFPVASTFAFTHFLAVDKSLENYLLGGQVISIPCICVSFSTLVSTCKINLLVWSNSHKNSDTVCCPVLFCNV